MKIISKLLVSILIFSLLPLGLVYGNAIPTSIDTVDHDGTATVSEQIQWELKRKQDKINRFVATQAYSGLLKISESQLIGSFRVQNNTRDGFQVYIKSHNKAKLEPKTTSDGETSIPYSLGLSFSGTTATQIYQEVGDINNSRFGDTDSTDDATYSVAEGLLVFGMIKDDLSLKASSPTDMNVNVTLDVDSVTAFMMAGEYLDTLTVTYKDL